MGTEVLPWWSQLQTSGWNLPLLLPVVSLDGGELVTPSGTRTQPSLTAFSKTVTLLQEWWCLKLKKQPELEPIDPVRGAEEEASLLLGRFVNLECIWQPVLLCAFLRSS